jgi:hypothetical protein
VFVASDEQIDAIRRRLHRSRNEILDLAHVLKGDRAPHDPNCFPRSRIMRALTGKRGQKLLGSAALALAVSRPRTAWRLTSLTPQLRPLVVRFLAERLLRFATRPASSVKSGVTN